MTIMDATFQYLSVTEAAGILGCTTGRVRQLLLVGEITGHKLGGVSWAIPHVEIDRYRKITHTRGRPRKYAERQNHNM